MMSTTALREFHGEDLIAPTKKPTRKPTKKPTRNPTKKPIRSVQPTFAPSAAPSQEPTPRFGSYSRRPNNHDTWFYSTNPTTLPTVI